MREEKQMFGKGMSVERKNKLANISAIFTVVITLFFGVLYYTQSDNVLPLLLGIGALIYGPLCFIFYLVEVAKGVFRHDDEEIEEVVETEY